MFKKLFDNRKNRYKNLALVLLPLFLVIIGLVFFALYSLSNLDTSVNVTNDYIIESMDYNLRGNATELQRDKFRELKSAIEDSEVIDDELIAGLVAENFVLDFYTFSNKYNAYDVGGVQYLDLDRQKDVYYLAKDYYYSHLQYILSESEVDDLLEVDSIIVDSISRDFHPGFDKIDNDFYGVSLEWTYKDVNGYSKDYLNSDYYITHSYVGVVKNGDRFEVIFLLGD